MRVFELAKKENLSVNNIIQILEDTGFGKVTSNSKLDENTIKVLLDISSGIKVKSDFSEIIETNILKSLPNEYKKENSNSEYLVNYLLTPLSKPEVKSQIINIGEEQFETYFNDFEAYSVCLGLINRRAKTIARDYFEGALTNTLLEAHQLAMEAVSKYGFALIKHLIKLPELPFRAPNVNRVFHEFDKQSQGGHIPSFRIAFTNIDGKKEKLLITFYKLESEDETSFNSNIIRVYNKSNNQTQFCVSRNGLILPNPKSKAILPAIEVFTSFSQDPMKMILHYGIETGECSVCGRPLTDSQSILIGIGPICHEKVR
jgi:hypothetical protein